MDEDDEELTSARRRNESKKAESSSVSKEKLKVTVVVRTPKISIKCSSQAASEAPAVKKEMEEQQQSSPQEMEVVDIPNSQDKKDQEKSPQEMEVTDTSNKPVNEEQQKYIQEMEEIGSSHPRCFELYQQIKADHFPTEEFYQSSLTPDEHKESLLQSKIIQSLRQRTIPFDLLLSHSSLACQPSIMMVIPV